MDNLEDVITDAVNDAQFETEPVEDTPEIEASAEVPETEEVTETPTEEATEDASLEVSSPAATSGVKPEDADEFAKLAGIPQNGVGGRENRIPYSRVKKITEKAVNEVAEAALGRKLNPGERAVDVVKAHVAQLPELTARVTDYESRLTRVGEFEDIMANEPRKFLGMLAKIPAYQPLFNFLEQAAAVMDGQTVPENAATTQPAILPNTADDPMPEPDEVADDGTKIYSMEGVKNLLEWQGRQVEARLTKRFEQEKRELEERYDPIANDWRMQRIRQEALPRIKAQLDEARKRPLFNESEAEILQFLKDNPTASLDAAYQAVVFPKLIAERNVTKQNVIRELQTAPRATSIPARAATKPVAPTAGPRSLEDVIKEQIESAGLK